MMMYLQLSRVSKITILINVAPKRTDNTFVFNVIHTIKLNFRPFIDKALLKSIEVLQNDFFLFKYNLQF